MSYAGLGQETALAPTTAQDVVDRTARVVAGGVAGAVIGAGVGLLGLSWVAYYMFVGRYRSRRVRRNRRRSR